MMARKTTWQELQARGGPYSPDEMRIFWDRPGMTKVAETAWRCDTCGRTVGSYTSEGLNRYAREHGTYIEPTGPTPPEDVQVLGNRAAHCDEVVRNVQGQMSEAYTALAKLEGEARRARAAEESGRQTKDPRTEAIRAARIAEVEGRITQLKAALDEALQVHGIASSEYIQAFAQWREHLRQDEQRANEAITEATTPKPKGSALERFLTGKL